MFKIVLNNNYNTHTDKHNVIIYVNNWSAIYILDSDLSFLMRGILG